MIGCYFGLRITHSGRQMTVTALHPITHGLGNLSFRNSQKDSDRLQRSCSERMLCVLLGPDDSFQIYENHHVNGMKDLYVRDMSVMLIGTAANRPLMALACVLSEHLASMARRFETATSIPICSATGGQSAFVWRKIRRRSLSHT